MKAHHIESYCLRGGGGVDEFYKALYAQKEHGDLYHLHGKSNPYTSSHDDIN